VLGGEKDPAITRDIHQLKVCRRGEQGSQPSIERHGIERVLAVCRVARKPNFLAFRGPSQTG
jgi:hypothetical protein